MIRHPRVVYLCNAVDERAKQERAITTDSPAATNKVLALSGAMRAAGMHCLILSLGRGRQDRSGRRHSAQVSRASGQQILYCAFWHLPILTHIVSFFSLTILLRYLLRQSPGLSILVYNRSYHYLPALLFARLLGAKIFLDLEDGYNFEGTSLYHRLKNTATRWIFNALCTSGAMVAASTLSSQIRFKKPFVCYGVAEDAPKQSAQWTSPILQILFSGTLLEEVGSRLLIDAMRILCHEYPQQAAELRITICGKGPCAQELESYAAGEGSQLCTFKGALSRAGYLDILHQSHAGLSLRLAAFEMGNTTFPSKLIEYASQGLLVVSTRSCDVPALFGNTALYLDQETPAALAQLLSQLPSSRSRFAELAQEGQARIQSVCSSSAVGRDLKTFFAAAA